MKEKFKNKISNLYGNVISMYPVTMVLVAITTILSCINSGLDRWWVQAGVGLRVLFWSVPFFMTWCIGEVLVETLSKTVSESVSKRVLVCGSSVTCFIGAFMTILRTNGFLWLEFDRKLVENDRNVSMWMTAYVLSAIILVLYYRYRACGITFEKYLTGLFVKIIQVCVAWGILAAGFAILGLIFEALITDLHGWFATPQILVIGLYVVPGIIVALSDEDGIVPKFFEGLIRYVLLIMTIIGAAIIYIYMIKLLVMRDIPSNSIFEILAALFFVAIPVGYACTSFGKDTLLQKVAYVLPYIYAPFILLQCYSVFSRLLQYGITPSRYMGVVLIVLEIIYTLVYAVSRKNVDKVLWVMLATVLLVTIAPGINVYSMSRHSQKKAVDKYLADTGASYDTDETKRIVGAYKYLLNNEGEEYVDAFMTKDEQLALSGMGMLVNEYTFRDFSERAYLNSNDSFIDVEGYAIIAGFDNTLSGDVDISDFPIVVDDIEIMRADLTDEINDFIDRAKDNESNNGTMYGTDIVDIGNVRLYITYIGIVYDPDSKNVDELRISGHICFKDQETMATLIAK